MMSATAGYKEGFRRRQARLFAERERLRVHTLAEVAPKLRVIGQRRASEVFRLLVFGSLVEPGRFAQGSDIDIAVEWSRRGDGFGLWREIEDELGREIDFRELGEDAFSRRVRRRGLVVYESGNRENLDLGDSRRS